MSARRSAPRPSSTTRRERRRAGAVAAALVTLVLGTAPRIASAQVHWDGNAHVGLAKRFLSQKAGNDAAFGPSVGVSAHIALVPLVRIGAYADADLSPVSGDATRRLLAVGLRAKVLAPWARGGLHAWAFVGAGYVGVYSPSFTRTLVLDGEGTGGTPQPASVAIDGAGGAFAEIPFGVGASYKLRKPWELTAELGAKVGFVFGGSAYGKGRAGVAEGRPELVLVPVGKDTLALGLTLGIGFDM